MIFASDLHFLAVPMSFRALGWSKLAGKQGLRHRSPCFEATRTAAGASFACSGANATRGRPRSVARSPCTATRRTRKGFEGPKNVAKRL